jgi:hypothetical protein
LSLGEHVGAAAGVERGQAVGAVLVLERAGCEPRLPTITTLASALDLRPAALLDDIE